MVVASGAKVLGSFTVGDHAKIGAGSVVLKPVPAYATVVGIPGRVVVMKGTRVNSDWQDKIEEARNSGDLEAIELLEETDVDLEHDELPDPERELIDSLKEQLSQMEKRLAELEQKVEK